MITIKNDKIGSRIDKYVKTFIFKDTDGNTYFFNMKVDKIYDKVKLNIYGTSGIGFSDLDDNHPKFVTWIDLCDCILANDQVIKEWLDSFTVDGLDSKKVGVVRKKLSKSYKIRWQTVIGDKWAYLCGNKVLIDRSSVDDTVIYAENLPFPLFNKICMSFSDFMLLIKLTNEMMLAVKNPDNDDDIEDHDDNVKSYGSTHYTEESMMQINSMAGHSDLDNDD